MNNNLTFGSVNSEQSFNEFVEFANTFDHKEGAHTILPAYTVRKNGEMIAYFKLITHPIVCPAFHPDKVSPRDFHDIVAQVGAWTRIGSISDRFPSGTTFLAVENKPAIDRSIIEKLGFKDLKVQVWQSGGA